MPPIRRAPEAQALFNPAFGAYLLASSIYAASRKSNRPLPWPSVFLVLPLVLPADYRSDLPAKSTVSLMAWLDSHPHHRAAFAERAAALTDYTRVSLRMALRHAAVEVAETGLRCRHAPRPASAAPGDEVADCARSAALVGRWLAVTEPATAFTVLGVRP